ncbi:MAG: hypothetical protein H8E41_02025 [Desulfobulbaceae bacterium]|uniref:Uncharacterized protein n=1 Tax=Candidatus Desulfobia pelagia TaxID=2841692 RepID=A0A8J6TAR5_9BACT|nr:hypothetical protein [Candidatus Desulfobia pelagia]
MKDGEKLEDTVVREIKKEAELVVYNVRPGKTVQHSYMNYRVTLHGFFYDQKKMKQ